MKVLIATDGSEYGDAAVLAAAQKQWPPHTELRVLTVVEPISNGTELFFDRAPIIPQDIIINQMQDAYQQVAATAAAQLHGEGRDVSYVVRKGDTAEEIVEEAREWNANLILVGSHNRQGVVGFLLGSVAQQVLAHAPCSVQIIPKPDRLVKKAGS
ncbi:MAG: universal stress protein [Acidobacteriota bacterium]